MSAIIRKIIAPLAECMVALTGGHLALGDRLLCSRMQQTQERDKIEIRMPDNEHNTSCRAFRSRTPGNL